MLSSPVAGARSHLTASLSDALIGLLKPLKNNPFAETSMVIDPGSLKALQDVIGGSRDDLDDLIAGFLQDAPSLIAEMQAAAEAGDIATVRRGAHSLKSNCRDLGALLLAQVCARLEADLGAGSPATNLTARVAEVAAHWPEVRSALEAELSGGQG